MVTPKISIIVPVYNAENYLLNCIESIKNQTLLEIEIIIIDDGSQDNSGKICDELANSDDRIRVFHQQNIGLGMTRNRGIKIAKGHYVGFVDADDIIEKTYYEDLYNYSEEGKADAVTGGITDVYLNSTQISIHPLAGKKLNNKGIIDELLPTMLGYDKFSKNYSGMSVCRGIFSKGIIDKYSIEFESERVCISEDAIFNIEFFSKCKKVNITNSAGYYYYHRNSGVTLTTIYSSERLAKYRYLYEHERELLRNLSILSAELEKRIQSMFIANIRVIIMQEASSNNPIKVKVNNIHNYLEDSLLHAVLSGYSYEQYPLKLKLFTDCMKKKKYIMTYLLAVFQNIVSKSR